MDVAVCWKAAIARALGPSGDSFDDILYVGPAPAAWERPPTYGSILRIPGTGFMFNFLGYPKTSVQRKR
jgi:hypothetical protein